MDYRQSLDDELALGLQQDASQTPPAAGGLGLRLIRSPVVPHLTKDHFGKLDAHNDATNAHGVPGYVSPAIDSQGLNLAIISGHGNDPLPTMGLYGVMSPIDAYSTIPTNPSLPTMMSPVSFMGSAAPVPFGLSTTDTYGSNFTQSQFINDDVMLPTNSSLPTMDTYGFNIAPSQFINNGTGIPTNPGPSIMDTYGFNITPSQFINNGTVIPTNPSPSMMDTYGSNITPSQFINNGTVIPTNPSPSIMDTYGFAIARPQLINNDVNLPNNQSLPMTASFVTPMNSVASIPDRPPITNPAASLTCPICQKTFSRAYELRRHGKKHLLGPKEFDCPLKGCPYRGEHGFHRKDKRNDHIKNRHPEIDVDSL